MAIHTIDFKPKSKAAKIKVISVTVEAKTPEDAVTLAKQAILSGTRFNAEHIALLHD